MMTEAKQRMSLDEVALLRELVRWRRNHGVDYDFAGATLRLADGRTIAWNTYSALHWPRAGEVGVRDCRLRPLTWHEVESVTQAVDVLVALGYLPARLSSAYRAGWDARAEATDSDGALDLITWPDLAPLDGRPAW